MDSFIVKYGSTAFKKGGGIYMVNESICKSCGGTDFETVSNTTNPSSPCMATLPYSSTVC